MTNSQAAPGRLFWRCRRGMKELDILLGRYLAQNWPTADTAERAQFESFLELPDPTIVAYLLGHEVADDPQLEALLRILRGSATPLVRPAD